MLNFPDIPTSVVHYACTVIEQGVHTVVSVHQFELAEIEFIPDGEAELSAKHERKVKFVKLTPRQASRWYARRQHNPKLVAPLATILMTPTLRAINDTARKT
jgi:hypothetical protein